MSSELARLRARKGNPMLKILGSLVLVSFLPLGAMASDPVPRGELFGGYSYFLSDAGGSAVSFHGTELSIAENINRWFGGALDVSSHWNSGVNVTTFMYGPVFSSRRNPRITPFVHVMGGGVRGGVGYLGISRARTTIGLQAGGGFDVRITKDLAMRVLQVDYVLSNFSGSHQANFRGSIGLVYRFSFGPR